MPECDGGFDDEWDCRDGRPLEDDAGQADPRLPPGARPGDLRRSFLRGLLPKLRNEIDRFREWR
jgi:hypothetical protein